MASRAISLRRSDARSQWTGRQRLGNTLGSLLCGVGPRGPVTYVLALSLMAMVALLACWYPAHRAMRVDPAVALRDE